MRVYLRGYPFHLDSSLLDGSNLFGVVGHQLDVFHPKRGQDRDRQVVLATIGFEAKFFVGLDGVESSILQFVGFQLGHQAYAATLLLFVNQDSTAELGDFSQRHFKLCPAVTAIRTEYVAGEALRVDAHQGRLRVDVAHDESDGGFPAAFEIGGGVVCVTDGAGKVAFKAEDPELSPASGEIGLGNFSDRIHATNYKRVRVERCDLRHQRVVDGSSGFPLASYKQQGAQWGPGFTCGAAG